MPDSIVQIEGVGNVQFPSSMSTQDIGQAAHKLYTGAGAKRIEAAPPSVPNPRNVESSTTDQVLGALAPKGIPHTEHAGASQEGMPGFEGMNASNDPDKAAAMTEAGTMTGAGLIAGRAMPGVARFMGNHPIISMGALEAAKHIPYVGKFASRIPTWAPLLAGKGEAIAPAAEAEGEAVGAELGQSRSLGSAPTVEPSEALGRIPASATAPEASFPPAEPTPRFKIPGPSAQTGRADRLEDQGIQQDMQNYLENQGKQVYAREPIGKSKGEMQADFNESTGKPSPPVKRTKTPGVKVSSPASKIPEGSGPTEDLTPLLQKSLEMARKKKGQ